MIDTKMIAALGVSAFFLIGSFQAGGILAEKTHIQEQVTENIRNYESSYQALQTSNKRWNESFYQMKNLTDMVSILSILDLQEYGMSANMDQVQLSKVDPISVNGAPLGLVKLCLVNRGGSREFTATASSFGALFDGLKRLASRMDVQIDSFAFSGDVTPTVQMFDLCLLVKT